MKFFSFLAILVSCLSVSSALGQSETNPTEVIEQFISRKQDTAKIFYVDSVLRIDNLRRFQEIFKRRKFTTNLLATKGNLVLLTTKEQQFILRELRKMHTKVWPVNLFLNSKRIPCDSANRYLSVFQKSRPYNPLSGNQFWEFSAPIFLRNNSLCIVSILFMCGSLCGEDDLSFYKKTDGKWERYVLIRGGVF